LKSIWVGLVVLASDFEVYSFQGLRFDFPGANFGGLSSYKATPMQVDDWIGPLRLVGP